MSSVQTKCKVEEKLKFIAVIVPNILSIAVKHSVDLPNAKQASISL